MVGRLRRNASRGISVEEANISLVRSLSTENSVAGEGRVSGRRRRVCWRLRTLIIYELSLNRNHYTLHVCYNITNADRSV